MLARRVDPLRLLAVVCLWAATFHVLSRYGVDILPRAVASALTLEQYLSLVHVVTLLVGVGLTATLVGPPRTVLALFRPSSRAWGTVVGLAPATFAAVTTLAFLIARPTLIEEILRGGRELAQKSTGQFGRELVHSPALLALLWGAVLSPVSEELFFRGALYRLLQDAVERLLPARAPTSPVLSAEVLPPGGPERALAWLRDGGVTVLVVTLLFGLLHRDMPGGLGIVRFVSALGLALACGLCRQLSGTVLAPIVLHVLYNTLSIATVRRWVVTEDFPAKYGAPTLVSALGAACAVAVLFGWRRQVAAGPH